jgi:hypothetical protein
VGKSIPKGICGKNLSLGNVWDSVGIVGKLVIPMGKIVPMGKYFPWKSVEQCGKYWENNSYGIFFPMAKLR